MVTLLIEFRSNQAYATSMAGLFQDICKALEDKDVALLQAIEVQSPLVTVRDLRPFEPCYFSGETRPMATLMDAFGYRIPVWKVINDALEIFLIEESNRAKYIDRFLGLFPEAIRYLSICDHARASDKRFSELGLLNDSYGSIHASESLREQSGYPSYKKLQEICEKICADLISLLENAGNHVVQASVNDLEVFRLAYPDHCRFYY